MKRTIAQENVSKFKIILPIFIFLLPAISWAADLSLPDARRVDWQGKVGVPGGIPTVTAICTTSECNALHGGNVSVSSINAAVASAANSAPPYNPSRITVVRIPAGTFDLGSGQIQINRGNVILRGAGKNQTILQSSNPSYFILTNGSGADYGPQGVIASGYTKGSTNVTLDDASAISPGDFMYLTQDSESFMYSDWSGIQLFKQLVYITNVSENAVSFSPPLAYGLSNNLHPRFQHYYGIKQGLPIIGYIGIEDLTIDLSSATSGSAAAIWYNIVYAPWVKNVEIANFGDLAILASYSVQGTVTEAILSLPNRAGKATEFIFMPTRPAGWLKIITPPESGQPYWV